jgi:F-type H+-transporting ATPase subunit a
VLRLPLILAAGGKLPDPNQHVLPHYLFGSDWFTNHHFMSLVVFVVGAAALWWAARNITARPEQGIEGYITKGRFSQTIETLCVFLRDEMTGPMLHGLTDRYIYFVWSTFFFILLGNVFGLLPIGPALGLINPEWSHLGGTFTGNVNFTAGLAIVSLFMMFFVALKENFVGFFKHMWVVPMRPLWLSPLMVIIGAFVFVLELVVSPVIRAFALCIRLFANMVAGHLVLASLIIMALSVGAVGKGASVLGAVAFSFMELFVAFLQAYIFAFLTVIFISLGAVHHDDESEHDREEAAHA